jgi:hypothetical protein
MNETNKFPLGILSVLGVMFFGKKLLNMNESTGNDRTDKNIATLHPKIRPLAKQFILKAKGEGINLIITDGFRTYAQQNYLYAQGRTRKGKKVTNAKGGQSNHNFGLAFDVVPFENGKINYESKNWQKIGRIGKSLGFKWGGDWQGDLVDLPHFEMMFGNTLSMLRNKVKSGNITPDNYPVV